MFHWLHPFCHPNLFFVHSSHIGIISDEYWLNSCILTVVVLLMIYMAYFSPSDKCLNDVCCAHITHIYSTVPPICVEWFLIRSMMSPWQLDLFTICCFRLGFLLLTDNIIIRFTLSLDQSYSNAKYRRSLWSIVSRYAFNELKMKTN